MWNINHHLPGVAVLSIIDVEGERRGESCHISGICWIGWISWICVLFIAQLCAKLKLGKANMFIIMSRNLRFLL